MMGMIALVDIHKLEMYPSRLEIDYDYSTVIIVCTKYTSIVPVPYLPTEV